MLSAHDLLSTSDLPSVRDLPSLVIFHCDFHSSRSQLSLVSIYPWILHNPNFQRMMELLLTSYNMLVPLHRTFRFDLERGAYDSEQRGVEEHRPVGVERHVHGDQPLAGHAVRAQLAEPCVHLF